MAGLLGAPDFGSIHTAEVTAGGSGNSNSLIR
jgi:hypothetical protein